MRLYIDVTTGSWGELSNLRVTDDDSPKVLSFFEGTDHSSIDDYLAECSDSEIIWFAATFGKHISSVIAASYREGYKAGINNVATGSDY